MFERRPSTKQSAESERRSGIPRPRPNPKPRVVENSACGVTKTAGVAEMLDVVGGRMDVGDTDSIEAATVDVELRETKEGVEAEIGTRKVVPTVVV